MAQGTQITNLVTPTYFQTTMPTTSGLGETWLHSGTLQLLIHDGNKWKPLFRDTTKVIGYQLYAGGTNDYFEHRVLKYYPHADAWTDSNRIPVTLLVAGAQQNSFWATSMGSVVLFSNRYYANYAEHYAYCDTTASIIKQTSFPDPGTANSQFCKPYPISNTESHHHWGISAGTPGSTILSNIFNLLTQSVSTMATAPSFSTIGSIYGYTGITYPEGSWWASSAWTWYALLTWGDAGGNNYWLQYNRTTALWPLSGNYSWGTEHLRAGSCGNTAGNNNVLLTGVESMGTGNLNRTKTIKPTNAGLTSVLTGPAISGSTSTGNVTGIATTKARVNKTLLAWVHLAPTGVLYESCYWWDSLASSLTQMSNLPAFASNDIGGTSAQFGYTDVATLDFY